MAFIVGPSQEEQWRDVVGYEGLYLVSDLGRVKSIGYQRRGLILRPYCMPDRYPMVNLWRDGVKTNLLVHQLVDRAFNGPIPADLEVNHIDGVKTNCARLNLERLTHAQNVQHAFEHGLRQSPKGMQHGSAVLTDDKVRAIRAAAGQPDAHGRFRRGVMKELAATHGASRQGISDVLHGRSWTHL